MQVALDKLGYSPCFHARFMPYITDLFDAMYDYAVGRRPDFPARRLFAQFNAAVDIPAPLIPLVLEAYPEAKVRACPCSGIMTVYPKTAAVRFSAAYRATCVHPEYCVARISANPPLCQDEGAGFGWKWTARPLILYGKP
jgi:hypothetical protein